MVCITTEDSVDAQGLGYHLRPHWWCSRAILICLWLILPLGTMGELSWMAWALEGWFAPHRLPPVRAAHLPLPGELALVVWVQEGCPNPQWPWD